VFRKFDPSIKLLVTMMETRIYFSEVGTSEGVADTSNKNSFGKLKFMPV